MQPALYLKYIANLREAEEVEEDIDARTFGMFLHNVMDWFYRDLIAQKQSKEITPDDLEPARVKLLVDRLVDRAFREHYGLPDGKDVEYKGQGVVARAIASGILPTVSSKSTKAMRLFRSNSWKKKTFKGALAIRVNLEKKFR